MKIKKETFEQYVQHYINFFKEYKTEDAQLKKLIVTDLQCILKRYKKEQEKNSNNALELQQIYSHLGVEAFGEDIQEQALKEIHRLQRKTNNKTVKLEKEIEVLKKALEFASGEFRNIKICKIADNENCYLSRGDNKRCDKCRFNYFIEWAKTYLTLEKNLNTSKGATSQ